MAKYTVQFDDAEIVKLSLEYGYGTPKKFIVASIELMKHCREEGFHDQEGLQTALWEAWDDGHLAGCQGSY